MQPPLTPALRRRLRSEGQLLQAAITLGRNGITPAFTAAVSEELALRELVKIKLGGEFKEQRHAVAEQLAEATGSALVQVVGHVVILYRRRANPPAA